MVTTSADVTDAIQGKIAEALELAKQQGIAIGTEVGYGNAIVDLVKMYNQNSTKRQLELNSKNVKL